MHDLFAGTPNAVACKSILNADVRRLGPALTTRLLIKFMSQRRCMLSEDSAWPWRRRRIEARTQTYCASVADGIRAAAQHCAMGAPTARPTAGPLTATGVTAQAETENFPVRRQSSCRADTTCTGCDRMRDGGNNDTLICTPHFTVRTRLGLATGKEREEACQSIHGCAQVAASVIAVTDSCPCLHRALARALAAWPLYAYIRGGCSETM